MEFKGFWFLAIVLISGLSRTSTEYVGLSPNQCAVPPNLRVDCGYPGVSPQQCNNRGCCFDSTVPQVPWCYSPLQEEECIF
ncbi:trefoil factor 3-like [Tachyglossus aculeatus]|uniref:trefoil factor 3-like n=1 Tax=Tachyglossus aculeatus TaxID=9261 RepID=UPI0018F6935A|nr:trefoil factor 3-like [Tachyglossus aculeatus]